MRYSRAWSSRATQAIVESPSAMDVSHIGIGAVSAFAVGFHIIMDNAPIHSPDSIDPIIKEKGYIPVYLLPYSLDLNPIEMFWKALKDIVKRGKRNDVDTLTSRVIEGSEDVSIEHLQNFIQHSIDIFPKCLNKEPLESF
ncbi:hypothetical protein K501DRAFT_277712 [Backusella circina FSU 941]|nr:hypothetical protein K501DRAFT_277712 [Backusella circina FSU 941]